VAFENLVHEVREMCLLLMCPDLDPNAQTLAEVPLHSTGMTAGPLREVFLALVAERMKQIEADATNKGETFPKEDKDAILAVAGQISSGFQTRTTKRNEVVHAKWFIGFGDESTDGFKETGYYKRRLSAAGLGFVKNPPRTAEEIDVLTKECDDVAAVARQLASGFVRSDGPKGMAQLFELKGTRWETKT
jgi:hypothetical protein